MQPGFLSPQRTRPSVDDIAHDTPDGTKDGVQDTEDSSVIPGHGLAHIQMAGVVRAEDGVDREFGAESARVGDHDGEGRQGSERSERGIDGRFLDKFPASGLEDVVLVGLHFGVVALAAAARNGGGVEFDGVVGGTAAGVHARGTPAVVVGGAGAAVGGVEGAEEGVADVEGALEILFPRGPGACGGVGAGE